MTPRKWRTPFVSSSRRPSRPRKSLRASSLRPQLEQLEDRITPAFSVVDGVLYVDPDTTADDQPNSMVLSLDPALTGAVHARLNSSMQGFVGGSINQVVVNGFDGDDTLVVDFSNGNPIPTGGLVFNGGGQSSTTGDSLIIRGGSFDTTTYTYTTSDANGHDGVIDFDGSTITFSGLEPIMNTGNTVNAIFTLTNSADEYVLEPVSGITRLRSVNGTFETTTFFTPSNRLTVSSLAGTDTINFDGVGLGAMAELEGNDDIASALNVDFATWNLTPDPNILNASTVPHMSIYGDGNVGSGAIAEIEPNDTLSTPQDVDGARFSLANNPDIVNSTSVPHISISATGDGSYDYYSFFALAGSTVDFDIDGTAMDSELFLYDVSGGLLASNDDDGGFDPGDGAEYIFDSNLTYDITGTGTYIIGVARYNSFDLGGGAGIGGPAPQAGDVYTLHISLTNRSVSNSATFDYYSFTVLANQTATFDIDGENFDTELFLYDTSGNLLAGNDNSAPLDPGDGLPAGKDSFLTYNFVDAGVYVIGVAKYDSTGDPDGISGTPPDPGDVYVLHLSVTGHALGIVNAPNLPENEPNNTLGTPQDVELGIFTLKNNGAIVNSTSVPHLSVTASGDGTFDYFTFHATAGSTINFDVDATSMDSKIYLYNSSGALLDFNDDDFNPDPGDGFETIWDSNLTYMFSSTADYILGVGLYGSYDQGNGNGIAGPAPQAGDFYTLHISLENHPTSLGALTVNLNGGSTADVFNVTPSPVAIINVDGGTPTTSPGDRLVYHGIGTLTTTSASAGFVTRPGSQIVNYTGIEQPVDVISVFGRAYNDDNGDGDDEDGMDAGINGVMIELHADKNSNGIIDAGDALDQIATTATVNGIDGYYQFTNLTYQNYIARQVPLAGFGLTQPLTVQNLYVLDPAFNAGYMPNSNFGNFPFSTITGRVFNDLNGDGDDETGADPGQNGVRLELYRDLNQNGSFEADTDTFVDFQTTTANVSGQDGVYTFANVVGGMFIVHQAVASGFLQTSPTMPADLSVTIGNGGATVSGVDFGSFKQPIFSGRSFTDLNGDGDDENGGDPGFNGVRVELYNDVNGTGIYDPGTDTLVTFQITATVGGVIGYYSFTAGPGQYIVREIVPPNQLQTAPAAPGYFAITASSGTDVPDRDFGNIQPAIISGRVYTDVDGNGTFNGSDAGRDGVVVQLWRDVDNNGLLDTMIDTLEQTATSNTISGVSGSYSFTNVGGGKHIVHEVVPAGFVLTAPTVNAGNYVLTTGNGTVINARDFGNFQTVTIGGRAFNDVDANGNDNGGSDLGVNGVSIQLYRDVNASGTLDGSDALVTSTSTTTIGTPGQYRFMGVGPGRYLVHEIVPSGNVQTAPASPGDYAITTSSGTDVPNRDFGNFSGNIIRGRAFTDVNGDGDDEGGGDPGLNGITINLYRDVNLSGTLDGGDTLITSTNTATSAGQAGRYQFTIFPPGRFIVQQISPADYVPTLPVSPNYYAVDGTGGGLFVRDFGDFQTVTVSGRKYIDLNGNGNSDGGSDPGLNGVTIQLYRDVNGDGQFDGGDSFVTSTTTANIGGIDGRYQITDVGAGRFIVREISPAGFAPTAPATGYYAINPASGIAITGRDFGNFEQVTISGRKFTDINGDGDDEGGVDPGLNGVTIQLYRDVNSSGTLDGGDTPVGSTTTANIGGVDGRYQLTGVGGGRYIVHEVPGVGYVQTSPAGSGNYAVTTASGVNVTGRDFGNFQQITLSGRRFLDNDGDGTDNGGTEAGINGERIELYRDANATGVIDSGDTLAAFTTTANIGGVDGRYRFTGVGPGSYIVREILPANFFQTAPPAPGYFTRTAMSGADVGGLDFGNFKSSSISGRTFIDRDGDGTSDGGTDPSLGSVVVDLYRDANGNNSFDSGVDTFVATQSSGDPSGTYSFTGLLPGSYFVTERTPAGYHRSTPVSAIVVASGADVVGVDIGNEPNKTWVAIGVDAGSVPFVRVLDTATGADVLDFYAYTPSFRGGVRVALGDVTGDGTLDVITATGPGAGPHVEVFDGRTGALVRSFYAYTPTFGGGVWVAAGDVDGDNFADIITGTGDGAPPHVKVFSGRDLHELASFYAYPSNLHIGVRVAAGDVDGDGIAEIITGTGPGAPPHVKIFNRFGMELRGYYAYDTSYTGGVFVSTGDIDGDRRDEIITGTVNNVPHVTVRDGLNLGLRASFIAFESTSNLAVGSEGPYTTGARVGSVDRNGDGRFELVVAAGPQRAPRVRFFDGLTSALIDSFFAFDPALRTGLFVG